MFNTFENLIDPLGAHDESMPPASLPGFYLRYCRQVWPQLAALMATGLVGGGIEAYVISFIGALVDTMRATAPEDLLRLHGREFLFVATLVLIARPACGLLHDLLSLQAIGPGMTNLIRWQTHRYVLRQSVSYFASDFAGRIASNMDTSKNPHTFEADVIPCGMLRGGDHGDGRSWAFRF
jgi:ATP-binding cassette subfamily B multidrug efflux pump